MGHPSLSVRAAPGEESARVGGQAGESQLRRGELSRPSLNRARGVLRRRVGGWARVVVGVSRVVAVLSDVGTGCAGASRRRSWGVFVGRCGLWVAGCVGCVVVVPFPCPVSDAQSDLLVSPCNETTSAGAVVCWCLWLCLRSRHRVLRRSRNPDRPRPRGLPKSPECLEGWWCGGG